MKRELAALESALLLTDGKTRSRNSNTVSVSPSLVYKRVKRSVTVKETDGSNRGVKGERKESTCDEVAEVEVKVVTEKLLEGEVEECNGTTDRNPRQFTRSAVVSNVKNQENVSCGEVAEVEVKDVIEKRLEGEVKDYNGTSERNPRLYTQSPLVSNVENEENVKSEENAELKSSSRSILKPDMEMIDSNLIEVSDCIVKDKENTEPGVGVENAKAEMDKDVIDSIITTPKKRMEMKMSKQILLAKTPTTVKELFETGLLEGCPVYYNGAKRLEGRIRALGILCSCKLCQGQKVIPISVFEIHARNTYKRAVQYICLENGRSLIDVLKNCKNIRKSTLEETVQNAIGPLPERKLVVCQNCKEAFYTMDANNPEPVCSPCIMSTESPIGPVFSAQKMWPFKSDRLMKPQSASPSSDVHPDRSLANLNKKSSQAICPMRCSPVASEGMSRSNLKKSNGKSAKVSHTAESRSNSRFARSSATKIAQTIAKIEEVPMIPKSSNNLSMGKSSKGKDYEELMNSLESDSSPTIQSSGTKASKNLMKRSFKTALSPKGSGSLMTGKSSSTSVCEKTTQRLKKEVSALKPLRSPPVGSSSGNKASGKITRKDLRLHKLVFQDDILPDGTELGYYVRGKKLLDGYKKGAGIFCNCCENVVSASQFEAHAGCAARRKPYCYIYTSNGVSLHELSLNLIQSRTHSAKFNDDLCTICADGGDLLLCDGCPRAFHMECTSLSSVPIDKWYCDYCQNLFEKEKLAALSVNAIAAGRIAGVDPIEQITTRSIRIVDTMAPELSACILCRGYDFCKAGFGPRTIILCDQCEKEYHVGCLKDHSIADLTELPEGKWFCSSDCGRIDSAIQTLMDHGDEKLSDSLVDIILKKHMEKGSAFTTDLDVRWRLLNGKTASSELSPLLNQAITIFHESFAPIIDIKSSQDLIRAMVYGKNVAGQEYGGMYCAVLTVDSVVVSAGIFRVFGSEIAELPLVATSTDNQGKGYFQALFTCIEKLLAFLKVKNLVLPAAEEAESIWTEHFGFTNMNQDEIQEIRRNYWSIVRFQGTSMLHKPVPECCITQNPETTVIPVK